MSNKLRRSAPALLLLPALLLGACGQAPASTPTLPVVTAPVTAPLTVSVLIPSAAQSQGLSPQYVSSATTGLRVQLGSLDTTLALANAKCVAAQGGQSCTFTLNVAPGANQTLTVSAYNAASQLLSTSTSTVNILAGQPNALSLSLTGVAASASLTPTDRPGDLSNGPSNSLLLDLGGTYTLGIALKDASGQTILNPGRPTETVTSNNAAFTVTSTGVGTFSMVAPIPTGTDQTTTLTVTSAGGAVLVTQVLTVPAQKLALSLSNTAPVAGSSVVATARLTSAQGQALNVAGRTVTFVTTDGSVGGSPTALTNATGTASLNILTGSTSGVTGTVTASHDGVNASKTYTSVNGSANTTTSTVTLTPASVKVGGASSLVVTLKDNSGNPVTTLPQITVSGGSKLGSVVQKGNVFTYPVTAAAAPETTMFTVSSAGNVVGSSSLLVTAYPLVVSDGGMPLTSGVQYDFKNGSPHAFQVTETGYGGAFTVTSTNTAVAMAALSGGKLSVTPGTTAGFSTIKVSDANGQSFSLTVSVTTVSLTIN